MSDFLTDEYFNKFKSLIYNESGIHFTQSNRSVLESRLKDRLRKKNLTTIKDYYSLIDGNKEEIKTFLDTVTTNLTRFFRNQAHYDTLINHVIPDLVERKKKKGDFTINLWSAGCSTGEEPYTNAMVLLKYLPPNFKVKIVGSDLSLQSLLKAQEGFYPEFKINGVPQEYLDTYFIKKPMGYQIKDEVKKLVQFDYHNLKFPSTMVNLDIVFCRNVLIYFDEAAQKNVIDHFYQSMSSHSYLFIGHSESLFGYETKFEFIKTDWACIYGKMLD